MWYFCRVHFVLLVTKTRKNDVLITLSLLFLAGPRRPSRIRLPSEIYYSSSNCTQRDNLNMVRQSFQSVLQATIRMQHACAMNPGDCIVEDVVAECMVEGEDRYRRYISSSETDTDPEGSSSYRHSSRSPSRERRANNNYNNKRRRDETGVRPRSSTGFILPIQFHFGTRVSEEGRWPIEYHKASTRLYGMFDYFERHVLDGTFTIKSRVTNLQVDEMKDSLTYAPVKAICDIGYKFNSDILLCGKHLNWITDTNSCSFSSMKNEMSTSWRFRGFFFFDADTKRISSHQSRKTFYFVWLNVKEISLDHSF